KEASELWAFAAAILPRVNSCDPAVAAVLRANADITSADAPMTDGYATVKADLETVYECMGITCEYVGGLVDADDGDGGYVADFAPCVDPDDSGDSAGGEIGGTGTASNGSSDDGALSGGGVAGITIAVGAVAVAAVAFFLIRK
ncbi:unnamed protein product, partial [Hapterophycus canaliculatus]